MSITPEERVRLKALRERAGLTTRALGARIGVTSATISNIESGRSKQVRSTVYTALRAALRDPGHPPSEFDAMYTEMVEEASELDARGDPHRARPGTIAKSYAVIRTCARDLTERVVSGPLYTWASTA